MEICVLGSGSTGNCLYVAGGGTHLLVDAGLSLKELKARLAQVGVDIESIAAVLFSHEHLDHCNGAGVLRKKHAMKFYANEGTASGIEQAVKGLQMDWQIFQTGSTFSIGGLTIEAFSVPHDASDAVGFAISDGRARLVIATDFGMSTTLIRSKLADCDALVLETNHDVEMLRQSGRPWSLIQRILGRHGHLSNEDAAELLASAISPRLKTVFLAHISEKCNAPHHAERVVRETLRLAGRGDVRVEQTHPDVPSARVTL